MDLEDIKKAIRAALSEKRAQSRPSALQQAYRPKKIDLSSVRSAVSQPRRTPVAPQTAPSELSKMLETRVRDALTPPEPISTAMQLVGKETQKIKVPRITDKGPGILMSSTPFGVPIPIPKQIYKPLGDVGLDLAQDYIEDVGSATERAGRGELFKEGHRLDDLLLGLDVATGPGIPVGAGVKVLTPAKKLVSTVAKVDDIADVAKAVEKLDDEAQKALQAMIDSPNNPVNSLDDLWRITHGEDIGKVTDDIAENLAKSDNLADDVFEEVASGTSRRRGAQKAIDEELQTSFATKPTPKLPTGFQLLPDGKGGWRIINPAGQDVTRQMGSLDVAAPIEIPGKARIQDILGMGEGFAKKIEDIPSHLDDETKATLAKFNSKLDEAASKKPEQAKRISEAKSSKIGQFIKTGEAVSGQKGARQQVAQLKGKTVMQFDPPKMTQKEIDAIFDAVKQNSRPGFDQVTGFRALEKVFAGQLPSKGEIKILREAVGKETADNLAALSTLDKKAMDTVLKAANLPRALMTTLDLSAPLRQGIFMISHPKIFAKSLKDMFKAFGSEKAFRASQEEIMSRPTYNAMKENGLAIMDLGDDLTVREEAIMSNWAEKIPGVRISNRAYTAFLNKMRADYFDSMYKHGQDLGVLQDPNFLQNMSGYINAATGRGDLKFATLERMSPALNSVFFSPKLMSSRLHLMNPAYYYRLHPAVRKEAIKTALSSGSMVGGVLALAAFAGADVETNPTSSDFAKIKVGDTRYDVAGGFQQYIKLAAQLQQGYITSSTTGRKLEFGEGYKGPTRLGVLSRFMEYKTAPLVSLALDTLRGEDALGEELDFTETDLLKNPITRRMIPMVAQDMAEAYQEWGAKGLAMGSPALFGVGLQTYGYTPRGEEEKKKQLALIQEGMSEKEANNYLLDLKRAEIDKEALKDQYKPDEDEIGMMDRVREFFGNNEAEAAAPSDAIHAMYGVDELGPRPSDPLKAAQYDLDRMYIARDILNNKEEIPNLTETDIDLAITKMGLDPEEARYFDIAKNNNRLKYIFVEEDIKNIDNKKELMLQLVEMRKEVEGEMILTSGVIDDLVDDGYITKDEGKLLKNVDYAKGKDGQYKVKMTGRGSGATAKKIKFVPMDIPLKTGTTTPKIGTIGIGDEAPGLGFDPQQFTQQFGNMRVKVPEAPKFKVKFDV